MAEKSSRSLVELVIGLTEEIGEAWGDVAPEGGQDGLGLVLLYGHAFREVSGHAATLTSLGAADPAAVRALHEALAGTAAYRTWQNTDGPVNEPAELPRLRAAWERVVKAAFPDE